MPPEKSVSAYKDIFFECQKMTIVKIFVKTAKKRGLALNVPRQENAKLNAPTKEKLFNNVRTRFNLTFSLFCALS